LPQRVAQIEERALQKLREALGIEESTESSKTGASRAICEERATKKHGKKRR